MSGVPSHQKIKLHLKNEGETKALATRLAHFLQPGDLILLEGNLGAGKSTLARQIIRSLLNDQDLEVPSPTFLLVLPYEGNGKTILHADLYRIVDAAEVDELGLDDDPSAIVLVEWPDRDPDLAKRATMILNFEMDSADDGRNLELIVRGDPVRTKLLADGLT